MQFYENGGNNMETGSTFDYYVKIILKRKVLITVITSLSVIVAGILNYVVFKPVYRGSASVYIASVARTPILKAKDVQSQITGGSFLQKIAQDLNVPSSLVAGGISTSVSQDSRIIVLNFDSTDRSLIDSFFESFINDIRSSNEEIYNTQLSSLEAKASILNQQLSLLSEQEKEILSRISSMQQDGKLKSEYTLEYSLLKDVYTSLLSQKVELSKDLSNVYSDIHASNQFIYQGAPMILDKPVKPHKLFNIGLSGILAFIASILLALFLERQKIYTET